LVTKPAICIDQQGRYGKVMTNAYQHPSCQIQFSLKRRNHAFDFGSSFFCVNGFLGEVKSEYLKTNRPNVL
jgi:hypothetical protein